MEPRLEGEDAPAPAPVALWRDVPGWFRTKRLSREFWVFFAAAFFFDAGFAVYFFLFNLYLLDLGFRERAIGLVGGALTFGTVVGTLPAGWFARRFGTRTLMLCCFVAAPALGVVRVFAGSEQAHIVLAFFAGVAMCTWGVCFLPTVAGLTSNGNRASAFGLIFSVSIGTSALGGLLCGYLPQWIRWAGGSLTSAQVKQRILLGACAVALVGLLFVLRLRLPRAEESRSDRTSWLRLLGGGEFLRRFLPGMMLWSAVIAAFTPFASVYLSRSLNVSLAHVGLVFSISQIVQLCLGLLTPLLFRALGLSNGVLATQVVAAALLAALAGVRGELAAVLLFVGFSAMQWMSSPGIYNLLMTGTADRDRSSAAALALFLNALAGSASTAIAGLGFSRYGYPKMLLGVAALALVAALAMRWSFSGRESFDPLDIPAAEVTT